MRDDVIEEAKRLGERIAEHPRTAALKEASAGVQEDKAARALQEDYARAIDQVHQLEAAGRPVEPEQKRKLATLGEAIRRSEPLQRLLKAHADFAELMDGVQRSISAAVDAALGGGDHEHGEDCDHDHGHDHGDDRGPEAERGGGSRIITP